jgi:uncharacterized protein involved in response to NO
MGLPALSRAHYIPVGAGLLAGQVCTLLGLFGGLLPLKLGALFTATSWALGTTFLVRLAHLDKGRTWHAVSCTIALGFGLLGLMMYSLYLRHSDPRMLFGAIKIASTSVLLPIYFTVCHRMIPFFASAALPGYAAPRPLWALALLWPLWLLHTWLELRHGYAWLWAPDLAIAIVTARLLWSWWPRASTMPALLRVLFVGFAWLPIAFVLYSIQSAWLLATADFILGRAPAHALFIGFFGSLLVAMVTRVTQGHSGRPLVLGATAGFAFIAVQAVAVTRVVAETMTDPLAWHAIAAAGWIAAFLPWVLRSGGIYLSARADGKPG